MGKRLEAADLRKTNGAGHPEGGEVTQPGKYWGFRCGAWCRIQVLSVPGPNGTGEIAYAPVDRRGYPYSGGIAVMDCSVVFGPVRAWGSAPPAISKRKLLSKGVSEFWLRDYAISRVSSKPHSKEGSLS